MVHERLGSLQLGATAHSKFIKFLYMSFGALMSVFLLGMDGRMKLLGHGYVCLQGELGHRSSSSLSKLPSFQDLTAQTAFLALFFSAGHLSATSSSYRKQKYSLYILIIYIYASIFVSCLLM